VDGIALIDTGATITSINAPILSGLGINPVGIVNVGTAGGPQKQSVYPAKFRFPGTKLPGFELSRVIGCDLTGQTVMNQRPLIALIGRDVLTRAVLVYNGSAGMFSLSF
jgi:predicted aspartyl protease